MADSDDGDTFEWDSNTDGEVAGSLHSASLSTATSRNYDAPGPPTLDPNGMAGSSASLVETFVEMNFKREMVLKAIKENGNGDKNSVLDLLLTYNAIDDDPSVDNLCLPSTVGGEDDDNILESWDDDNVGGNSSRSRTHESDDSDNEDFLEEMSQKDEKIESLVIMGFPEAEAEIAVTRCGHNAPVSALVEWICSSETAGDGCYGNTYGGRKKTRIMEENKKKRKRFGGEAQRSREPSDGSHDKMHLPKPMVGFGLPSDRSRLLHRSLPNQAIGPPFFYFENVALAPKDVWSTISRFLYEIEPEFVDSKFFCAASRKRGYIHNLPIENRSPLLPLPPKTIVEAFPRTKEWWPSWDLRTQFNCLQTCVASAKLTERIRNAVVNSENPQRPRDQKFVLEQCRKWNLVWVGQNTAAPLEPHEIEFLLGFPNDHTRGISRTDRYKSLGNSFQVDTVAYHLSVLRDMFPHGMNVLSLFSGIGGAEVALHRLGIRMKTVVSVEISEVNRTIVRTWWDKTQTGTLIEIGDVQSLTSEKIEAYIRRIGSFDLVIGGSPCNNLTGSNRHHRDGLEGEHSFLFYHYVRILESVKSIMKRV